MRIVGIGDNVVDRYVNRGIMFPGGNAVNFAVYAKRCGEDAAYLGLIADEPEGWLVYDSLRELGVEVDRSKPIRGITTERCDVRLDDGDRVFIGCEYGEGEWTPLKLNEEHLEYLRGFDVIHCGCYACMEDEIAKLRDIDAVITYDFSSEEEYRTEEYLQKVCPYVDIALFSAEEMTPEQSRALREKVIELGTKLVLVTNGSKGQVLWDGKTEYQGVVKLVEPVDTMGAGDSFFTSFVVAMMRAGYGQKTLGEAEIHECFEYAADFSANNCLLEGAFGFATKYKEPEA